MFVFLAGELLPGPDDADAVVGKFVMRARQLNLGHVAVGASRLANLAHAGLGLGGGVARQTTEIIVLRDGIHFLVRIMAGDAADAGIIFVEALTPRKAIGLESERSYVMNAGERNFLPCTVTLATEV